jgi:FKBP-type peptidyl-prolyl cis-trans isomerase
MADGEAEMQEENNVDVAETDPVVADAEDLGLDISEEGNGGLFKKIVREGTGKHTAPEGSEVCVHYVGKLTDGTEFDSSRNRNETFKFKLGQGSVIKGWDTGVKTMKKGEVAVLTCSPDYGYGEIGSPPKIPKNARLVFEIELFDWKGESVTDVDDLVTKVVLRKGTGFLSPNYKAEVKVHMVGSYEERVFDDREITFIVGEGINQGIIEGVELAVEKMKQGEQAEITVEPKYGYGSEGSEEFGIPPNATLTYEIELIEFTKVIIQ